MQIEKFHAYHYIHINSTIWKKEKKLLIIHYNSVSYNIIYYSSEQYITTIYYYISQYSVMNEITIYGITIYNCLVQYIILEVWGVPYPSF